MERKLPSEHPVLRQLPAYLAHALDRTELRIERLGLSERRLSTLGRTEQLGLVA